MNIKKLNNSDQIIESLKTQNEALILVIEELVARLDEAKKKPALDPVGKEDGDIDNDGDEDETDKYLLNRRKAIGKAIGKKKVNEDVETLVGGRIKVPARSTRQHMVKVANEISNLPPEEREKHHDEAAAYFRKSNPRFNAQKFRTACGVSTGMHSDDYVKEDTLLEKFKKVASEIRHLMKDNGYPQKRAVAAALSMKRKGELDESMKKKLGAALLAAGMAGSPAAADSVNPSETNANYNPNKTTITQPTKRNLNWRKAAAIAGAGLSTAGLVMSLKRKD